MISAFIFVSSLEFESRKIKILNKWLMEMQLPCFHQYFCNQWLSSPFDKWQVFTTPKGYSTTNSCEPLNAEVKKTWT